MHVGAASAAQLLRQAMIIYSLGVAEIVGGTGLTIWSVAGAAVSGVADMILTVHVGGLFGVLAALWGCSLVEEAGYVRSLAIAVHAQDAPNAPPPNERKERQ